MFEATQSNVMQNDNDRNAVSSHGLWSVDRWGRLLAGSAIVLTTALGILHHPAWLIGTLLASTNLIITSVINRCPLHDLLIRFGAKEREDLYLPGGAVRPTVRSHSSNFPPKG